MTLKLTVNAEMDGFSEAADDLNEKWVSVRGVPTCVLEIGAGAKDGRAFVIIPGNPGVPLYYEAFMRTLHTATRLPVYCIAHAGHVTPTTTSKLVDGGPYDTSKWLDLDGQVEHKLAYIADHLPASARQLILIGHSIGCHIILKMLSAGFDRTTSSSNGLSPYRRVIHCALLFPTIERMAESPQGRIVTPFLRYFRWLVFLLAYLVYLMPDSLKRYIIGKRLGVGKTADRSDDKDVVEQFSVEATMQILRPPGLQNVAYMAHTEMEQVRELDAKTVAKNLNCLWFYYGANDHWCPVSYYHQMKKRFPGANVQLCALGIEHAFVLQSSTKMAQIVCDQLKLNETSVPK